MGIKINELDDDSKNCVKNLEIIERLDRKKEIVLLLGKDILLKLELKKTVYDTNYEIQKLIKTKNLASKKNSNNIKNLVSLNKEIKIKIDRYKAWTQENRIKKNIEYMESMIKKFKDSMERTEIILHFEEQIKKLKEKDKKKKKSILDKIFETSSKIKKIEDIFEVNLASTQAHNICNGCGLYLGTKDDRVIKCSNCKNEITSKDRMFFDYMDLEIEFYLEGAWFEDYISKVFRGLGWSVWTGDYVLGSSGVNHEIDILAIKNGYVLIGECKSGKCRRSDVFNFSAKGHDIKSNFSFWVSLEKLPDKESSGYMKKTPGFYHFENLANVEESALVEFLEKIEVT